MFVQVLAHIEGYAVPQPPVFAIVWAQLNGTMYETVYQDHRMWYWKEEVRLCGELEVQMAIAGIGYTMHATHISMLSVIDDFNDHSGPTWELYRSAIEAGKTVAEALSASMILHDDPQEDPGFDSIFILIPKKGE